MPAIGERLNGVRHSVSGTPGTGATVTLGLPIDGFLSMAQAGAIDGWRYEYAIESTIVGGVFTEREMGTGVWTSSASTLTRDVINSTNSNGRIDAASDAHVIITALAQRDPQGAWLFSV